MLDTEAPEGSDGSLSQEEIDEIGFSLFDVAVAAVQNDPEGNDGYNNAEVAYLQSTRRVMGRDIQYDFTTSNGVRVHAGFYRSNVAVYQSTRVSLTELDSATPHSIRASIDDGDFNSHASFSAGDLSNSRAAEEGFRKALDYFFKPQSPQSQSA